MSPAEHLTLRVREARIKELELYVLKQGEWLQQAIRTIELLRKEVADSK